MLRSFSANCLHNTLKVRQHLLVCESNYGVTLRNEPRVTVGVLLNPGFKIVALAIELKNQSTGMADEVSDEFSHGHLPAE